MITILLINHSSVAIYSYLSTYYLHTYNNTNKKADRDTTIYIIDPIPRRHGLAAALLVATIIIVKIINKRVASHRSICIVITSLIN